MAAAALTAAAEAAAEAEAEGGFTPPAAARPEGMGSVAATATDIDSPATLLSLPPLVAVAATPGAPAQDAAASSVATLAAAIEESGGAPPRAPGDRDPSPDNNGRGRGLPASRVFSAE